MKQSFPPNQRRALDGMAIVAVALCCVLAVFLLSIAAKFLLRRFPGALPVSASASTSTGTQAVEIDWAKLYPYSEQSRAEMSAAAAPAPASGWVESTLLSRYTDVIRQVEATIETYATDDILLHDPMVELANAFDRALGWEIRGVGEYNGLVSLGSGYLGTSFPQKDMSVVASDIASFDRFCRAQALPLLYVQLPFKISESDAGISGVVDFSNKNATALVDALSADGVAVLDLRPALAARQALRGESWHAAFFRTDHHWLPQTGLWAAGEVAARLNAERGFSLDGSLLDASRFRTEEYARFFLGSQGKKATLAVASPEDFYLLYPKADASLTLSIPSLALEQSGGFEVVYQYESLRADDLYNDNAYSAYCYADVPLKTLVNHDSPNDLRLLVLQDSFSNSLMPFLALTVRQIDALDLRSFSGSVEAFLNSARYDAVIVAYSVDLLGYDTEPSTSPYSWHNFR